jgi:integrase
VTFRAYAGQWAAGAFDLKPSTRRSYQALLQAQLLPAFGEYALPAITVEAVNTWLATQATRRKPTLRNALALLHKILADAQATDQLALNRLHGNTALRRPKAVQEGDERVIEVLSPAEVNQLLDTVRLQDQTRDRESYPLVLTAALTGLRLGELLAL